MARTRPLDLISFTIRPSVSTCAVNALGALRAWPFQVSTSAPLFVTLASRPGASSASNARRTKSIASTW
ncbi:MAG: hypothetical protein M5R40_00790 [Anaerolineae bacterium]|nr:hypothetical protein [Anaerolineae bacterium]